MHNLVDNFNMFPSDYKSSRPTVYKNIEDVKYKTNKFVAIIINLSKV